MPEPTKKTPRNQTNLKLVQLALLALAVLVGVFVYRDYGVGYDESHNYYYGHEVYNQVMGISGPIGNPDVYEHSGDIYELFIEPEIEDYFSRTHGPLYEVILAAADRIIGIDTASGLYHFRHAVVYITFVIALILFYFYGRLLTGNAVLATLGSVALFFSPRVFGHAFHNSYDTAFLTFFLAASVCCLLFIRLDTRKWALLAGVTCGLAVDVRFMALMLLPLTLGSWLLVSVLKRRNWRLGNAVLFVGTAAVTLWLFWPALWDNPIAGLIEALRVSARDPWGGSEVYLGERILGEDVPWHFTPVWMLVTIPVLYIAFFFAGVIRWFSSFRLRPRDIELLFVLGCLLGPLVAVAVLRSTLFNGWRHFYFIYPSFLVFALLGAQWCWRDAKNWIPFKGLSSRGRESLARKTMIVLGILQLTYLSLFMVQSHPHQMIFFNSLLGMKRGYALFEVGLWGPQFREALEWLLESNPDGEIRIAEIPQSVGLNVAMLEQEDRDRIKLVPFWEADYFVHSFRAIDGDFRAEWGWLDWQVTPPWERPPLKQVWERRVWGAPVVGVYDVSGYGN